MCQQEKDTHSRVTSKVILHSLRWKTSDEVLFHTVNVLCFCGISVFLETLVEIIRSVFLLPWFSRNRSRRT